MAVKKRYEVGFIGGGNMAEALIKGLVEHDMPAGAVIVSEPLPARRKYLRSAYKVAVTDSNQSVGSSSSVIVLAVKPQIVAAVLADLAQAIDRHTVVLSIAAGVRLAKIERGLGAGARVVRCMPNTPCLVGSGAAVLCAGKNARKIDVKRAKAILAPVATVYVSERESLLDAVTGLSGSGPAYVYRFAEALIRGGRKSGLDDELARALTYQTILGAAQMLLATNQSPEELRKAVSSPGGTTLAGLAALDDGKFVATVESAVKAASRRSRELGKA